MRACFFSSGAAVLVLLWSHSVDAWTPPPTPPQPPKVVGSRQLMGSFLAVSTILSNTVVLPVLPSQAAFTPAATTTLVVAARSGGRAGGRAAAPRSVTRPVPQRSRTTTTIVTPPPVIVTPGYGGGYGYGGGGFYNPSPSGLGLAIGLNAVSGISEGFREARQENEIRSTRDQLNDARVREAEMAVKLQQLEQQMQQQQQQLIMSK